MKIKRGEARQDGMVFWEYYRGDNERWVTPSRFRELREYKAKFMAAKRQSGRYKTGASSSWRFSYRQKQSEIARIYRQLNPERIRVHKRKRKEAIKRTDGNPKMIIEIYRTRDRLIKCTGISWHVDHIIPISRGGEHHERNLQVITAAMNMAKSAKI